jgi:hypothetical protein
MATSVQDRVHADVTYTIEPHTNNLWFVLGVANRGVEQNDHVVDVVIGMLDVFPRPPFPDGGVELSQGEVRHTLVKARGMTTVQEIAQFLAGLNNQ